MMLGLIANNKPLRLGSGTTADIEYVPPLFADGIEESQSTPFEIPMEGNVEALGHVQELSVITRDVSIENCRMEHDGIPLDRGVITVLATTERTARIGFQVDGFLEKIKGKTLPEALVGEVVDLAAELENDSITLESRPLFAAGGNCQFPMFFNPSQYGDEHPGWYPTGSDWDATRAYAENDLVSFTVLTTIERTYTYQCIDAGGTTAGQSPITHPAKWRRTSFGLVNAWDEANNQHYYNELDANFYTFVPWFYVKWIMQRALASIGFTLRGDWVEDEATHELLLPNATTIDESAEPQVGTGFSARQTGVQLYTPGTPWNEWRMPAHDESTPPLGDTLGQWNNTLMEWTCPATTGTYRWRLQFRMNRNVAEAGSGIPPWVQVSLRDSTGASRATTYQYLTPTAEPFIAGIDIVAAMGGGDVGQTFYFSVRQTPAWPTLPNDALSECWIRGWLESETPTVSQPASTITVSRHVPQVELGQFIVAWADAYNLEIVPDMARGELWLNYRDRTVERAAQEVTYHDHRVVSPVELDHQRNTRGMRLHWDLDDTENELELDENEVGYFSEEDLPAPLVAGLTAVVRSTRKLLRSTFSEGQFVWRPSGYLVRDAVRGEQDDAREVTPDIVPLHMEQVTLDGRQYLVPVLDVQGNSDFYHGRGEQKTIHACYFKTMASSDGTATGVPGARTWGYGWDASDLADGTLLWDQNSTVMPGIYQRAWTKWVQLLLSGEAVTMDILLDIPFLMSKVWRRMLHMMGQRYLVEKLPVSFDTTRRELVSRGAYLLRVRASRPELLVDDSEPVFLCEGEGYASIVVTDETAVFSLATTTGYSTVRDAATGTLSTVADFEEHILPVGSYCLWASDDAGEPSGDVLELYELGGVATVTMNTAGLGAMTFLLIDSLLTDLTPPSPSVVVQMLLNNTGNTMPTLDLSEQTELDELQMTGTAAALDLSGSPSLRVLNVNNPNLAEVTPPTGTPLQSISIGDGMLEEASVDALINACDASFFAGLCTINGGTNSPRGTASDTNHADCLANGWTFNLN